MCTNEACITTLCGVPDAYIVLAALIHVACLIRVGASQSHVCGHFIDHTKNNLL